MGVHKLNKQIHSGTKKQFNDEAVIIGNLFSGEIEVALGR